MAKKREPYEPPKLVVLGTVAELTTINQPGPNFDIQGNSPSSP